MICGRELGRAVGHQREAHHVARGGGTDSQVTRDRCTSSADACLREDRVCASGPQIDRCSTGAEHAITREVPGVLRREGDAESAVGLRADRRRVRGRADKCGSRPEHCSRVGVDHGARNRDRGRAGGQREGAGGDRVGIHRLAERRADAPLKGDPGGAIEGSVRENARRALFPGARGHLEAARTEYTAQQARSGRSS